MPSVAIPRKLLHRTQNNKQRPLVVWERLEQLRRCFRLETYATVIVCTILWWWYWSNYCRVLGHVSHVNESQCKLRGLSHVDLDSTILAPFLRPFCDWFNFNHHHVIPERECAESLLIYGKWWVNEKPAVRITVRRAEFEKSVTHWQSLSVMFYKDYIGIVRAITVIELSFATPL